jgi:hypothetical protein
LSKGLKTHLEQKILQKFEKKNQRKINIYKNRNTVKITINPKNRTRYDSCKV